MEKLIYYIYRIFYVIIPSFFNCCISGLSYQRSWNVVGRPRIIKRKWYERLFKNHKGGVITIGQSFSCNNKVTSNSIGVIQPCVFNIAIDGSEIIIGNNVGISGSTINASKLVTIEDNVIIGSGCLITDTDSHPINYVDRMANDMTKTHSQPIHIMEGSFIGARSIIMKGVTIGRHSVVGAGSVVTKSVPDNSVVCGNPAIVVRMLNEEAIAKN